MPRYIDATDLVRRVLVERDKIPLEVVPRYNFGVPEPCYYGQHMRGGIRKALREIEISPTVDAVEVVRCKDCKAFGKSPWGHFPKGWCMIHGCHHAPDYFCASAKEREKAEVENEL